MPVNCNFRVLRELVTKRFTSSKLVLIKHKDIDDDLVTITFTSEFRLAKRSVDSHLMKEHEADKSDSVGILRLNIVEVSIEQEPPILEEEEEKLVENERLKGDESGSHSPSEFVSEVSVVEANADKIEKDAPKEKTSTTEDTESKEVEMDDWLFEFAQLFRSHVGIDSDAHIDLHELGMEFCSEALEEIVTSGDTQDLFHFLIDEVSKGSLRLEHCSSTNQIIDILTKSLNKDRFDELRGMLGMLCLYGKIDLKGIIVNIIQS